MGKTNGITNKFIFDEEESVNMTAQQAAETMGLSEEKRSVLEKLEA